MILALNTGAAENDFLALLLKHERILECKVAATLRAGRITLCLCLLALVIWRF